MTQQIPVIPSVDEILETEAYKIIFPWTDPDYDPNELCTFMNATTPFAFFEIQWAEGGTYQIIVDGELIGSTDELDEAKIQCHALFCTRVIQGLCMMAAMGIMQDKEFDKGAWNVENLRAFVRDQAYGADLLSDQNIGECLDLIKKGSYTDNMEDEVEQAGHFTVEAVKPTIH